MNAPPRAEISPARPKFDRSDAGLPPPHKHNRGSSLSNYSVDFPASLLPTMILTPLLKSTPNQPSKHLKFLILTLSIYIAHPTSREATIACSEKIGQP